MADTHSPDVTSSGTKTTSMFAVTGRPQILHWESGLRTDTLVAPLVTHGHLSDPGNSAEEARAVRDSTHSPKTPSARDRETLGQTHDYDPPTGNRQDSTTETQNLNLQTYAMFESEGRRTSHATSTTLENATTRNTSKRGSSSNNEALLGDALATHENNAQSQSDLISPTQRPSYPPPPTSQPPRTRKYHRLHVQPMQDTHFFLKGHLMTGGDNVWPLIGSIILVLGLGGLWLGTTGVWVWRDGLGGGGASRGGKAAVIIFGYLLGVCFGAMIATAFRDPGILPRNLDITYPIAETSSGEYEPATREVRVRHGKIALKYCDTCKLYRPPRSSHCRLCGNCVEGIDHHCSYLHNCVGKRNYTSFITFLVTSVLALTYTVVFSALHYSILCSRENINFGSALGRSPEAAVSFILGVIFLAPIIALLGYHLRLMLINATTVEQIRAAASKEFLSKGERPINHYTYGSYLKNFAYSLCRPQNPSWIDASGWDVEATRIPNPGVKNRTGFSYV